MDGVLADFDRHHEAIFGVRACKIADNVDWAAVRAFRAFPKTPWSCSIAGSCASSGCVAASNTRLVSLIAARDLSTCRSTSSREAMQSLGCGITVMTHLGP